MVGLKRLRPRRGGGGMVRSAGAFHLPEQGQHGECPLGHRRVRFGVSMVRGSARIRTPTALFEVVDHIHGVPGCAAKPVQGVHDQDVTVPHVGQCFLESGAGDGGSGFLVHEDVFVLDAGGRQGIHLPGQILVRRRYSRIANVYAWNRTECCSRDG